MFVSLQISHHTSAEIALQINGLRVFQGGLITLGLPIFKVSPYVGLFASVVILGGFLATTLQKNTDRGIIAIALLAPIQN